MICSGSAIFLLFTSAAFFGSVSACGQRSDSSKGVEPFALNPKSPNKLRGSGLSLSKPTVKHPPAPGHDDIHQRKLGGRRTCQMVPDDEGSSSWLSSCVDASDDKFACGLGFETSDPADAFDGKRCSSRLRLIFCSTDDWDQQCGHWHNRCVAHA